MRSRRGLGILILATLLATPATAQPELKGSSAADVVLEWNAITLTAVSGTNGVEQVRLAAITHLAIFEAVNAIVGDFKPYLGTIVAPAGASPEAAAVAAAHAVLGHFVPDQRELLDAARAKSLAAVKDGPGKESGIAVGEASAAAFILLRTGDGSQPSEFYVPESTDPGQWQLTPTCPPEGGLFLHWRNLTPFGIRRGDQFRSDPPPSLTSRRYARDYNEVMAVGGAASEKRPEDRADVARFYAVTPSQAVWNPIARQVAAVRRSSLSDNARAFALLNMALNDALVANFDSKYHYTFWRPETAIRAGESDGNPETNPDATFEPFIPTPCFPSYPSAHASASSAAREILERLFGNTRHFLVLTAPSLPNIKLHYTRLSQVTDDIDDARIYGGIHYRIDQRVGARQGRRLGAYVFEHNLRRLRKGKHGSK